MIDLNQVVRETLSLRAYEQRVSNVNTLEALASGLPRVFADPHHVKQVLLNLIINAEQAMLASNGRGALVIANVVRRGTRESVVLGGQRRRSGHVHEDVQAKIFDPFFTTKAVGQGTGLGPDRGVRHRAGARRQVFAWQSEAGVREPRSSWSSRRAARVIRPGRTTGPSQCRPRTMPEGARVLVVEDEPALSAAVSEALTDAGFQVDRAGDGQEALDRISRRTYTTCSCATSKCPRMDGPALHREILTED